MWSAFVGELNKLPLMYLVFQTLLNYLMFQIVNKVHSLMIDISWYGFQSQMSFWYLLSQ